MASGGQRPRMMLNTLKCTGQPLTIKNNLFQNIDRAEVESSTIDQELCTTVIFLKLFWVCVSYKHFTNAAFAIFVKVMLRL